MVTPLPSDGNPFPEGREPLSLDGNGPSMNIFNESDPRCCHWSDEGGARMPPRPCERRAKKLLVRYQNANLSIITQLDLGSYTFTIYQFLN